MCPKDAPPDTDVSVSSITFPSRYSTFPKELDIITLGVPFGKKMPRADVRGRLPVELQNSSNLGLGIDETGRGAVVGPKIYAMVIVKGEDSQMLSDAGHADSKKLNSIQREALANRLTAAARGEPDPNSDKPHPIVGWVTVISHAEQIDHVLLQNKKYTLNWIAEESTALYWELLPDFSALPKRRPTR